MKKRIFCLLLILTLALASCSGENGADGSDAVSSDTSSVSENAGQDTEQATPDVPADENTEYVEGSDIDVNYADAELLIACHTNDGVNVKEIEGNIGGELVEKLSSLTPNGGKSAKISDEPFSFQHYDTCYAPLNTFWIKTDDGIYRISPEKEVSKCADYYSEGDTLDVDDAFLSYIDDIWKYYPRNTLHCVYKDGQIQTRRVFDFDSDVVIELVSLDISSDAAPDNSANSVTVKITSKTDRTELVEAVPRFGENEFANTSEAQLTLKAGTPAEVTLNFGGWQDKVYDVNVIVDDAKLHIEILP